jgi:glucose/arabinose dehydrogenase
MGILYITVFIFIACASGSIVTVWGSDHTLPANYLTSPDYTKSPEPIVFDDDLTVKKFSAGLENPTTMCFIGDDILILEKNTGKVIRIKDSGVHYNEPVLDVAVDAHWESGFLGITCTSNHVFLYFSESESGSDTTAFHKQPMKNLVYRYDWNGEKLINPILIKELPGNLDGGHRHNGGAMTKSQNSEIYFVIGDLGQRATFQNIPNKTIYETSSIFKIDTENNNSVELYAMGIRNSFGLAIDPITGYLWDTENSAHNYDEINLVKPGFNSGWRLVMGPVDRYNPDLDGTQTIPPPFENFVYSDPEFSFKLPAAVTAIEFPDGDSFEKYSDWLFVGDYNNGRIYKFQLNSERTGFIFSNPELSDLVLDDNDEIDEILFAEGFQTISDIEFHDGAMYVVSISDGSVYKIYEPTEEEANKIAQDTILTLILVGIVIVVALGVTMGIIRRKRISS